MKQSEKRSDGITVNVLYEAVGVRLQDILTYNTYRALQNLNLTGYNFNAFYYLKGYSPFEPIDFTGRNELNRRIASIRKVNSNAQLSFEYMYVSIHADITSGSLDPKIHAASESLVNYFAKSKEIENYVKALYIIGASEYIVDDLEKYIPKVVLPRGIDNTCVEQYMVQAPFDNPNTKPMYDTAVKTAESFKDEVYIWEVENML